ncbi:MAG TPA: FkbM family methyltransferase [Anaerolineales bacterium]|nr:FkbM family methyltransferase [Anaerolineales bacterium]
MRYIKRMLLRSNLGKSLRLGTYPWKNRAMLLELLRVPVAKSGLETINGVETPFVVLSDGVVLYGILPSEFEKEICWRWKNMINPNIREETFRVAMDVVLRYQYPHAMPHITMPYPRQARKCFHPQHAETIADIPRLSENERKHLVTIFELNKGEKFLDVGAYMGFGAVRMARELGPNSKIIAVEADPKSLALLDLNIRSNNLQNVSIVQKAVSSVNGGTAPFYITERQANSLVSGVVDSGSAIQVPTVTIDGVLDDFGMDSIDRVSLTINGAEAEALKGMQSTLAVSKNLRLSIAGWYKYNGKRVCDIISPFLERYGYRVLVGRGGGVLAWKVN